MPIGEMCPLTSPTEGTLGMIPRRWQSADGGGPAPHVRRVKQRGGLLVQNREPSTRDLLPNLLLIATDKQAEPRSMKMSQVVEEKERR